jgi:hypothetical protein
MRSLARSRRDGLTSGASIERERSIGDEDLAGLVEDGFLHAAPLRPGEGDDGERRAREEPKARLRRAFWTS